MRYYKTQTLTVSEDDSTRPKKIRFEEKDQEIRETFVECKTGDINLPASTTFEIPMGAIGTASWFYLFCNNDFQVKLDDNPAMALKANAPNELFVEFSKIEVVTGSAASRLTYAIGGGE